MEANPVDPHSTRGLCTNCGTAIYRTLLETSGPTRTYWRHTFGGFNACPVDLGPIRVVHQSPDQKFMKVMEIEPGSVTDAQKLAASIASQTQEPARLYVSMSPGISSPTAWQLVETVLPEPDDTLLSLDTVVTFLDQLGIPAYVEQTGGGCATIYAGEPAKDEHGDMRYPVIAGPGWFAYGYTGPSWANRDDFYIGPDDQGESPSESTEAWDNYKTVALRIAGQLLDIDVACQKMLVATFPNVLDTFIGVTIPWGAHGDHRDAVIVVTPDGEKTDSRVGLYAPGTWIEESDPVFLEEMDSLTAFRLVDTVTDKVGLDWFELKHTMLATFEEIKPYADERP